MCRYVDACSIQCVGIQGGYYTVCRYVDECSIQVMYMYRVTLLF